MYVFMQKITVLIWQGNSKAPKNYKPFTLETEFTDRTLKDKLVLEQKLVLPLCLKPPKTQSISSVCRLREQNKFLSYKTAPHLKKINF